MIEFRRVCMVEWSGVGVVHGQVLNMHSSWRV